MNKDIENLIIKSTLRSVQIEMLKKQEQGLLISSDVMLEILEEIEDNLK